MPEGPQIMKNISGVMFESSFVSYGYCNVCFHEQQKMETLQIPMESP